MNSADVHFGITYDRTAHVEREEAVFANPSNLERIAACPAAARKICKASKTDFQPSAKTGLTIDRVVHEAIETGRTPAEVAPDLSPADLKHAEEYYKFLVAAIACHPDTDCRLDALLHGSWIPFFCGIADCILVSIKDRSMAIIEHKTGTSKAYTCDGLQVKCYAVMAYDAVTAAGSNIRTITRIIVQPDKKRLEKKTDSAKIVEEWREEISYVIQYAAEHPDEYHPDKYRCLCCPHRHTCGPLQQYDANHGGIFKKWQEKTGIH